VGAVVLQRREQSMGKRRHGSVLMGASWGAGSLVSVCRMTERKSSLIFAGKWLKSRSANPSGRAIGSRVKFSEAAMANLLDDWTPHGPAVMARVGQVRSLLVKRVGDAVSDGPVARVAGGRWIGADHGQG
jgi:hypothetical protein